jgi:hypothetical protein
LPSIGVGCVLLLATVKVATGTAASNATRIVERAKSFFFIVVVHPLLGFNFEDKSEKIGRLICLCGRAKAIAGRRSHKGFAEASADYRLAKRVKS